MRRRFIQHDIRHVTSLEGIWDFAFLGDAQVGDIQPLALTFDDVMAVPGCFDATPGYAGRRGLAAYRKTLELADGVLHRLVLSGVHHWCHVFLDGERLGEHIGGFTRFHLDIPPRRSGTANLVVLADNRLDFERCPLHLAHYDWYHYGGIARGAELHRLGQAWIEALRVTTRQLEPPVLEVQLQYGVAPSLRGAGTVPLVLTWDGAKVWEGQVDLAGGGGAVTMQLELPGATLWSPEAPHLHLLHALLGDGVQGEGGVRDDLRQRIGIRQVKTAGEQILLNGSPLVLKGFNRHDAHPQFGHAQPESLLVSDLQQLRDMGCNFVRGSHYPQDELWLDLCDEAGFCVWSEVIGWQNNAEQMTAPAFLEAQLQQVEEMLATAHNHPSVILWGALNEGHSFDARCRPTYEALLGKLRQADGSRPVTYASDKPETDLCFDLADVISINFYPGWYYGTLEEVPQRLDWLAGVLDARLPERKPYIISEIGAGGIPGWHDWNGGRWTEEYQARLLESVIRHLFARPGRFCGLAIWLFNDFRTRDSPDRPRSFNDKGVVDEYRRPKAAYFAVKEAMRATKLHSS